MGHSVVTKTFVPAGQISHSTATARSTDLQLERYLREELAIDIFTSTREDYASNLRLGLSQTLTSIVRSLGDVSITTLAEQYNHAHVFCWPSA